MLQPLIATLIVLLAAYWAIRKIIAVVRVATGDSPLTPTCGACNGCSQKKAPPVISLGGPSARQTPRS